MPAGVPATDTPVASRTPEYRSATASQAVGGPAIRRLHPGAPVTITSIHMLDVQTGWALGADVGPDPHVLRTEDGGQTWADLTPAESAAEPGAIRSVAAHFEDVQHAWVSFNGSVPFAPPASPVIWRTEDRGATWSASAPLDVEGLVETYDPMFLTFSDLEHGWFAAGVGVGMNHQYINFYRTIDAGRTWEKLIDPYGDSAIQSCTKTGLLFLGARTGWLTGDCFGVATGVLLYRTGDGGTTWDAVALPSPDESPGLFEDFTSACGSYDAQFFDALQGVLGVRCTLYGQEPYATVAHLYATSDGGQTWASHPYPGGTLVMLSPSDGLALGRDLYRTADGGQHWSKIRTVSWEGQFSFVDELNGWAVARSEEAIALVHTATGGSSWELMEPEIRRYSVP